MNLKIFIAGCLIALACPVAAIDRPQPEAGEINGLHAFFDDYLSVYNRRFGHPERSAQFRKELGDLVRMPLLQVPPAGAPFAPESVEALGAGFERFVTMLEQRGVARLRWQQVQLNRLSENKVLANNVGHGVNEDGEVVYETVSLYLLYRDESGWRISLFNPYSLENRLSIRPAM